MNAKIPSIVEIVRHRIGQSDLSEEQKQAQRAMRGDGSPFRPQDGLIVPFYESVPSSARESRAMSATGTTSTSLDQGGQTIPTVVPEIGAALRGNLVLEKLGARIWGGVDTNISLPRVKTVISAAWLTENAVAPGGQDLFATLALTPYRVTAFLDVSDELLKMVPLAEPFLRQELMAALGIGIEVAVVNGSGASGQPLGILGTVGIGSVVGGVNGAAPTGANLLDLEFAVTGTAKADKGNVGWLASPYVRRKLRQTAVIPAQGWPVWDLDSPYALLGHPAGVTPSVPDNLTKGTSAGVCSAIICGEFSELFVIIFGKGVAIDALRDATLAAQNLTRVYATAYVNSGVRSTEAFAAMKDALCA